MKIEPFPPPQPLPLHASQPPVRTNQDLPPNQQSPMTTPIYDQHTQPVRPEKLSRRLSQTIPLRASADEPRMVNSNPSARPETTAVSTLPPQVPPPVPESRTPSAPSLPPGAAQPITYGASPLGSHSNPQSPAGTQSPSQPWSNKLSPPVPKKSQPPTVNGIAPPPRANGNGYINNVQYPNGRSGAESHENGGEGSIHSEEKDKSWPFGFFGSSKEKEREKQAQQELTRMIGGC